MLINNLSYKSNAIFGIWTIYRGTILVRRLGLGDLLRRVRDGLRSSFFSRSRIRSSRRLFLSTSSSSFLRSRDLSRTRLTLLRFGVAVVLLALAENLKK